MARSLRRRAVLLSAVALLAWLAAAGPLAQTDSVSSKFVGAWTLLSWVVTDPEGNERYPHGRNAAGQLVYTESGRVGVHQLNPQAELPDVSGLTPAEAARRLATVFAAYFGTYTVDESAGIVTHHLEGVSDPTLIGTAQVRQFEFIGDDRLLLTAVLDNEIARELGAAGTGLLTWERVR